MEICLKDIDTYRAYLAAQEKAEATIHRYIRCVMNFYEYVMEGKKGQVTKECLLEFKRQYSQRYSISSTNLEIIALNSFFVFLGEKGLELTTLKSQKKMFRSSEIELNQQEVERLYRAARQEGGSSLSYVLLCTLSGTGIRVSELEFLTVEAVRCGCVTIYLKGKERVMPLPPELIKVLEGYCRQKEIAAGRIFLNRNGEMLHRSQVWRILKRLAAVAGVSGDKVFPHNFRHLFAVTYYEVSGDICELANLLGHTSIETTRIYLQKSMNDCIVTLGLVFSRWESQSKYPEKKKMQQNIHSVAG